MAVPIIDLFAGPGGLGEGFSSVVDKKNKRFFKIALSIERDEFAHKTLTLRSFLRQFPFGKFPKEYYQLCKQELPLEELYKIYPKQYNAAHHEAWRFSLGDQKDHEEIDKRIRAALEGEKNFVLIGGPPCQAYSLVGRARRQEKEGLNKEDERVFLYREYYRILAVHQPAVFIMENVKGLLSSKVDNESVFKQLLSDLKDPVGSYRKLHGKKQLPQSKYGYTIYSLVTRADSDKEEELKPSDFVIRAEKYGIPQTQHRVILLGVRSDISKLPGILTPEKRSVTVRNVISHLPELRSGLSKSKDGKEEWQKTLNTIVSSGIAKEIDKHVWDEMKEELRKLIMPPADRGGNYVKHKTSVSKYPEWYLDDQIEGVVNHETRGHIQKDLWRYLFVSCFGKVQKRSPKLEEFPNSLLPEHKNARSGDFANRFKVQLWDEPSKTITSHISKDGHYFIHPDPRQCRSFTVREAARIQTFPDNYLFCGPRTAQFHQVGNAVPPLLAYQVANLVQSILK